MATRRLLIDTHIWLWLNGDLGRLSAESLAILAQPENEIYLSAASAWEMGTKFASGKLALPLPPEIYIPTRLVDNGIRSLAIRQEHAIRAAGLPLHHRDPFDRMLIAQAQIDDLELMTVDRQFAAYEVELLWAGGA